jgi:hypothetical protein
MKLLSIRSLLALSVAALLSACGAGNIDSTESGQSVQTAAAVQTSYTAGAAMAAQGATVPVAGSDAGAIPAGANQAVANQAPQPDCAPEGCRGLRIIDANAEEYRLKAQRLAAAEAAGDPAI